MDTFCIEYEITKKDYISAIAHDLKKTKSLGCLLPFLVFIFMFSIGIGLILFLLVGGAPVQMIVLSCIASLVVAVLLAMLFSRRGQATMIVRGRLRRGEMELQYFGHHRMELREDIIELQYGTIFVRRAYAGIQKIAEFPDGILVYNSQLDVDIIPSTAFADAPQRAAFLNHLQARISQAKNVDISNQSAEERKQAASYTLEYTWDEPSFINAMTRASRLMFTTRLGWSVGRIICTLIGLYLCLVDIIGIIRMFTTAIEFDPQNMLSFLMFLVFTFWFLSPLLMTFTPWVKKLYRQQIKNGIISRDYFDPQTLCFKDDRITELRRLNNNDVMYDKVYCVKHDTNGMYILLKGKRVFVIPNSAFPSDDLKREIANYIENKIKKKAR